jgi:hypothetical protein
MLDNLYVLVQTKDIRDNGATQHDMFANLDKSAFAAWRHPFGQHPLF